MNTRRLRHYLAQVGCANERITTSRSPDQHCNDALATLGLSAEQIAQLDRSIRSHRARQVAAMAIFQTANVVAFGLAVHRFEQTLTGLSMIIDNWDTIKLAYSVADALGWDTTAELLIVTAKGSVPIAIFLLEHSEELQSLANAVGLGAEVAAVKADLADAVMTGGASIVLSFAAWGFVKWLNAEPQRRLKELESRTQPVQTLHVRLASGAPPKAVREQLPLVPRAVARI